MTTKAATQKGPAAKKTKRPVSNQVQLDSKNPIPFEYGGRAFSFVNQSRYVPFIGTTDSFVDDLLEARVLSATHNACVITKKDYCAGKGLRYKDEKELPQEFIDWIKVTNRKLDSVVKLNRKIFEAFFTFGNVPIEIVRYTVAGKKHFHVYCHNLAYWRLCPPDQDGIVTHAVYSKLFTKRGVVVDEDTIKTSKKLPLYSPLKSNRENWFKDEKGVERTMIWYKDDFVGYDIYGLPRAIASLIFQVLEYKGARYNLDNFDNNMVVSAILALKGNLSQTEATRIGKDAIKTHTGDGKRGRVMVVASEEGIEGSDFHAFDTHKEGSYSEIDDKWVQKIVMANQWDSVVAGIQSPSTLGKGSGFLTKILEHLLNATIKPAQENLMDEVWKHILEIGNEWMGWNLEVDQIEVYNNIDISGLTDVDITPAVQINEVRKAKGLPEDTTKDGVYLKESAPKQNTQGGPNV